RNDNNNAAAISYTQYRFRQRVLASGIQIRTRLIEYDRDGIAINRSGQSNTLTLPGRKGEPPLADLCAVSIRKREDEIMRARSSSSFKDGPWGLLRIKARYIDCDAAVEQLDVLRKIPDMPT